MVQMAKCAAKPQKPGENCGSSIDADIFSALHFARSVSLDDVRFSSLLHTNSSDRRGGLTLNKNDLVAAVAGNTGLSKADASKAVDGILDAVTSALKGGNEVRLVGFGTFSVAARKATQGRNPRTGETIQIPASNQPKFKAGKALKSAVN